MGGGRGRGARAVRVLLAEDHVADAVLAERAICHAIDPCEIRRVDTPEAFAEALGAFRPDVVVTDYQMPRFDGLEALRLTKEHAPFTPVIIVTGAINEETAVACMKAGAMDYVLKERLRRLGPAVEHALEERELRLERHRAQRALEDSERRLSFALGVAHMGVWEWDARTQGSLWTPECAVIHGLDPDAAPGPEDFRARIHPEDLGRVVAGFRAAMRARAPFEAEYRIARPDGELRWLTATGRGQYDAGGRLLLAVGTIRDTTAQRQAAEALRRAKEAAEEASRMKSVFLANMSHEIRTPLTAIIGYADLLAEQVEGPAAEFAARILRGGERLTETLDAVITLARLEGDRRALDLRPVDVVAEVRDLVALFRPRADARGLRLTLDVAPHAEDARARLDRGGFVSVLQNLVANALKFTPEGGVSVVVDASAHEVRVHVEDTGIGINAAFLPRIFETFSQESSGDARAFEGSGLGLAIAKQLTERMGGHICVASAKGEGSRFTVAFPRANAGADARPGADR